MKKLALITAAYALPLISFAQGTNPEGLSTFEKLVTDFKDIVDLLIPIFFGLALVVFFYGLVLYIFSQAEDKAKGKGIMIWGVVALFVMASVWGLVAFIQETFGIDPTETSVQVPGYIEP